MSPRSPAWHQRVDQPEAWANAHRWLLQEIFDLFDRDGGWPTVTALQRSLADKDTDHALAAGQLVVEMPSELGARNGEVVVLNARALSHCSGAQPLLEAFVAAIRLTAAAYRDSDAQQPPHIDGAALQDEIGLDDAALLKLIALLEREPWAFGNGGGNAGKDWHRSVGVDALRFEDIDTIGDYLDALSRHRFGPPDEAGADDEAAVVIALQDEWTLGERIGGGGFADVYAARCGEREAVAKLIPKEPGADRELLLVELQGVRNVVPVIDHGETDDHFVLVMPRATMSLRDHILQAGPARAAEEVRRILAEIAVTLEDIEKRVVHRDIKPENVLLLDGHWCLTDFGISRYVAASTAADTRKHALTEPYAAPEQWRREHAEAPADMYALGVIGYELLAGRRPFLGPDFRDQHLHHDPPTLADEDLTLTSLISDCLGKAPDARPKPTRLLERLAQPPVALGGGLAALQRASGVQSQQAAHTARERSRAQSAEERRAELFRTGEKKLAVLLGQFIEALTSVASTIMVSEHVHRGRNLRLGQAELRLGPVSGAVEDQFRSRVPFEVVAFAAVSIEVPQDPSGYKGRGHSLWFCDAQQDGHYAWFETAFTHNALVGGMRQQDPFALPPGPQSGEALGPGVGMFQVAWPFMAIETETLTEFTQRWAGWLAQGSEGRLHRPNQMPEQNSGGSWRKS